ncbi:site-specific DNA-methyltransferase [Priestia flexa]|uniref:site-specific DNA-methyltransferase n=1 Tax=Priestia flexa TaxID=86664 RepID=UPI002490834D|nr:site-specific DNA-methyltransferase [Priestia flexa]
METELLIEIKTVLSQFPEYWDSGTLIKSRVIEDMREYRKDLIEALFSNEKIKVAYSVKVDSGLIIKLDEFISMLRYKNYWENSYTKFRNDIGLTSEGKYLRYNSDVVIDFPYKDCILEGGMTKEDTGRDEVYYHNVLAKEELDIMLSPKVLANAKKYSEEGEQEVNSFNDNDNLIIRGNNLIALSSLRRRYQNKIKCIYIDVPYYFSKTVENDTFKYNSNFKLSTWLTFMKNRLEIAYDLLSEKGVIFIHSNDESQPYLKVLCDQLFGASNFLNTIAVNLKNIAGASGGGEDKRFKKNVEYINIYAKDISILPTFNNLYSYTELHEMVETYRETGVSWKYTSVLYFPGEKKYIGSATTGSGDEIKIYERINPIFKSVSQLAKEENLTEKEIYYKYVDRIFQTQMPQSSIRVRVMEKVKELSGEGSFYSIEYTPKTGRYKGILYEQFYKGKSFRLLAWLKDVVKMKDDVLYKADLLGTYWDYVKETKNLSKEGQVVLNNGKKPERLLKNIIECSTNEGDVVMDFFLGSGTTAAVAHKMNRRYIGIEQLDYGQDDSLQRLKNVIDGEQSGISKDVEWQGGGSFVYAELQELNIKYVTEIQKANNDADINKVIEMMNDLAYLNFKVDVDKLIDENSKFAELSLEEKKHLLIEVLDANQLYLNYSEIDDSKFNVPESVKKFNHSFYQRGGETQ